jgi:hypothetical protein
LQSQLNKSFAIWKKAFCANYAVLLTVFRDLAVSAWGFISKHAKVYFSESLEQGAALSKLKPILKLNHNFLSQEVT